jgi:hypothetical protein
VAAALNGLAAGGTQGSLLEPHPDSRCARPMTITAAARLAAPAVLLCDYVLDTDMSRVRVPAERGGERRDGLWRHTCFEAFANVPGLADYCEFNFSPARDWAAYRFPDYRKGVTPAPLRRAPGLTVRSGRERLELSARIELTGLADLVGAPRLKLALAAVIEEEETGALFYFALRHGPGAPDFHDPGAFVLELDVP